MFNNVTKPVYKAKSNYIKKLQEVINIRKNNKEQPKFFHLLSGWT